MPESAGREGWAGRSGLRGVPEEAGREGRAGCSGPSGADHSDWSGVRAGGGLSEPRGLGCEKRTCNGGAGGARRERHT